MHITYLCNSPLPYWMEIGKENRGGKVLAEQSTEKKQTYLKCVQFPDQLYMKTLVCLRDLMQYVITQVNSFVTTVYTVTILGENETIKTVGEGVYWPARKRFMPPLVFDFLV